MSVIGCGKASPIRLSAPSPVERGKDPVAHACARSVPSGLARSFPGARGKVPEGRMGATRRMPHQLTP